MVTSSIDFGTTNSVAGINTHNAIEMVHLGKNSLETKSVLFYSFEDKNFYIGDDAIKELKYGTMGRYLTSLKSFLGSKENIETTLGKTTYSLEDLISIIIKRFKNSLDNRAKQNIEKVVLGRPVRFNDNSNELDKIAEKRLENAAKKSGYKEVVFQYEPIAAALAYEQNLKQEELILVADIGGGTTDYTIIKVGGENRYKLDRKDDILSTYGVYVGGNTFDSQIIKNFISPFLGKGTLYKNMGKEMEISGSLYTDLSQWHLFQRMYNRDTISSIEKLIYMSYEKDKIGRLLELIKENLYFDFSEKIIDSKVALSSSKETKIDMSIFKKPFHIDFAQEEFNNAINQDCIKIEEALKETMSLAQIPFEKIDKVFLTGGSTLVPKVKNIYLQLFPKDKIVHTDVFSSVGYGLAIHSNRVWNM